MLVPKAAPGWHGLRHSGVLLALLGGAVPQTPGSAWPVAGLWGPLDLGWGFPWHSSAPGGFAWRGQGAGGALQVSGFAFARRCGFTQVCMCCMPVYLHRRFNVSALPGRQGRAGASLSCVCTRVCSPTELNRWCWPCPCCARSFLVCMHRVKVWV